MVARGVTTGEVGGGVVGRDEFDEPFDAGNCATARAEAELDVEVTESLHVAVTVKVYEVPASKPVTVQLVAVPEHTVTPVTLGTDVTA